MQLRKRALREETFIALSLCSSVSVTVVRVESRMENEIVGVGFKPVKAVMGVILFLAGEEALFNTL